MKGSLQNAVREWISKREIWLLRLLNFVILLVSILVLNQSFGYAGAVSKPYFAVMFSVLGAFLPTAGVSLLLAVYLLIQMLFISTNVFLVTFVLLFICFILNVLFKAKHNVFFVLMPTLYRINLIYLTPIEAGFMGRRSEVLSVISGAVMAFYLREVRLHALSFKENDGSITILSLLRDNVLGNPMFYVFVLALVVLFLSISVIHAMAFKRAWLIALVTGIVLEFLIMLAGYILTDNMQQITGLLIGNGIAFLFGLLFTLVFYDMDHSRMEKLQYEDDEYYYYVTAVPKIQFVDEQKDVKHITKETQTDA